MLRLQNHALPDVTTRELAAMQKQVDNEADYESQVASAKGLFKRRNTASNKNFRVVRSKLLDICPGQGRCCYCEVSQPDEVEHIYPKDLYPDRAFVWTNYLMACGPCNGTWKNNRFAVIDRDGLLHDVTRKRGAAIKPPRKGKPALIDPRSEDPLHYLELDIVDTFLFLPRAKPDTEDYLRAEYTIGLQGLNERTLLPRARASACGDYFARLAVYRNQRDDGASSSQLKELREALLAHPHPFVWREMQRQPESRADLKELFADLPEALSW